MIPMLEGETMGERAAQGRVTAIGHAKCPYEDCDRAIGSPQALADPADRKFPPAVIDCPRCGRPIRLSWRLEERMVYSSRRGANTADQEETSGESQET